MSDNEKILEYLKHINEKDSIEKIYDEHGNYIGALVSYTNPVLPELKNIYHPYIPLGITSVVDGDFKIKTN